MKNNIDTIKKQRSHKHIKEKDKFIVNKSDNGKLFDKLKSTQRTETEETGKSLNNSRSISSAILTDKIIKIENPK